MGRHASWELEPGAEIAPGRTVLQRLGGGNRYEVHLVWDDELFSIMVAKMLRPDQLEDSRARRGMAREAEALEHLSNSDDNGDGKSATGTATPIRLGVAT